MAGEIIKVFPETNLRSGHPGLADIAQKARVNLDNVGAGEFLLFINKKQTAFKLFAPNTVIHYKHPRGKILLETVQHFPQILRAGKFSYDKALERVLDRRLKQ